MEFIDNHENLLFWSTLVSIISVIASILLIPWIVTKIPADYFTHPKRQKLLWGDQPKIVRFIFILLKNIIGVMLVLGGIALLFLPGQGILTILIGLLIMDFPYKYKFEIWIIKHTFLLNSINKLRSKAKKRPLVI
ncbi:PGPGW domain-containing protein [Sulfurovum sp. TSL1]|uniref:PGPGW domain-containing protein n=1 Tax=Sulfurovum sp. TSL1 TaxID=2826994 RepID=UPI001CC55A9C|nr:PGPGW domain-containing protein [Sulfurovum sp. TSL1]